MITRHLYLQHQTRQKVNNLIVRTTLLQEHWHLVEKKWTKNVSTLSSLHKATQSTCVPCIRRSFNSTPLRNPPNLVKQFTLSQTSTASGTHTIDQHQTFLTIESALLLLLVPAIGLSSGIMLAKFLAETLNSTGLFTYEDAFDDDDDANKSDSGDNDAADVSSSVSENFAVDNNTESSNFLKRTALKLQDWSSAALARVTGNKNDIREVTPTVINASNMALQNNEAFKLLPHWLKRPKFEATGDISLNIVVNPLKWDRYARAFQLLQLQSFVAGAEEYLANGSNMEEEAKQELQSAVAFALSHAKILEQRLSRHHV